VYPGKPKSLSNLCFRYNWYRPIEPGTYIRATRRCIQSRKRQGLNRQDRCRRTWKGYWTEILGQRLPKYVDFMSVQVTLLTQYIALKWFSNDGSDPETYEGARELDALVSLYVCTCHLSDER
jgi:hypothetical protein